MTASRKEAVGVNRRFKPLMHASENPKKLRGVKQGKVVPPLSFGGNHLSGSRRYPSRCHDTTKK